MKKISMDVEGIKQEHQLISEKEQVDKHKSDKKALAAKAAKEKKAAKRSQSAQP